MPCHLVIAKGASEGKQFVVVQPQTTIGRTDENDIVLAEVGVSRAHARLTEQDGRYFLEDLGSANGTLLNGLPVDSPRALSTGDSIAVGPVVLAFSLLNAEPSRGLSGSGLRKPLRPMPEPETAPMAERTRTEETEVTFDERRSEPVAVTAAGEGPPEKETMIAPLPQPPPGRAALVDAAPSLRPSDLELQETRLFTQEAPRSLVRAADVEQQETRLEVSAFPEAEEITNVPLAPSQTVGEQSAIQPVPAETRIEVEIAEPSKLAPRRPLASDRARRRRQAGQTLGGQLSFMWSELSRSTKMVILGGLLAGATVLSLAVWSVLGGAESGPRPGAEADRLGPEPLDQSFGLGPGVQFVRPDMKIFRFEYAAPTQAVALLHYQASDISPEEVTIILNGVEQGTVPPDTAVPDRELEQVLSANDLKPGEPNQLTFDNLRNPPGQEAWMISALRLEIIPVPDLPTTELLLRAQEFAKRGRDFYELRDVGSDNLFKAWKSYRQAWITLLALAEPTRPELYDFAAGQMTGLGRQLDQQCRTLMLEAMRAMQLKNPDLARETLEGVARYFPTTEHRCHNLALRTLNEYEL